MRRLLTLSLIVALAMSACGSGEEETVPTPDVDTVVATPGELRVAAGAGAVPAPSPADVVAVAGVVNQLGFDLLAGTTDDTVVSPLSIYTALAMLRAGADAETGAQLDAVLRRGQIDEAAWHAAVGALRQTIATPPSDDVPAIEEGNAFEIALADSAWLQRDFAVREDFLAVLANAYDAGLFVTDFAADPQGAVEEVNAWVADATRGRIPQLFDQLDPATVLALVDAITFTASWETAFEDAATSDQSFTLPDGSTAAVPMMAATRSVEHTRMGATDVVRLPYVGGDAAMLLFVPPPGGLPALETALDAAMLAEVHGNLAPTRVDLWLPRFEHRTRMNLKPALEALGIVDAFTADADLSRIAGAPGDLFVGQAVHEAWIDVREAGTEAAAATGLAIELTAAPDAPLTVHADRPFLYLLVEETSGTVLFVGRVTDPR